jgi:hypothetical protein
MVLDNVKPTVKPGQLVKAVPSHGLLHNGASVQLWNIIDALRSSRDNNTRARLSQGAYQLIVDLDRAAQASVVLMQESDSQTETITRLTALCNEQAGYLASIADGSMVVARDTVGEETPLALADIDHG